MMARYGGGLVLQVILRCEAMPKLRLLADAEKVGFAAEMARL